METKNIALTQICVNILKSGGNLDDLPREKVPKLPDVLNEGLGNSDKPIIVIAELAGINNATIHKILNGEMHPGRNVILRLAFVLQMNFETTQVFLKSGNRSLLSGGRERDRIIMKGIVQKLDLGKVCDDLTDNGFDDLFSKRD